MILAIAGLLAGAIVGLVAAAVLARYASRRTLGEAQEREAGMLREAEETKQRLIERAKAEAAEFRRDAEEELRERENDLREAQRVLSQKGNTLDQKNRELKQVESRLGQVRSEIERGREALHESDLEMIEKLAELAGTTREAIAQEVLAATEQNLAQEARALVREIEAEIEETADERARRLIADITQRLGGSVISDSAISTISLSAKELGRARNMAEHLDELAELTSTSLSLSEEASSLHISANDPVNRELARLVFNDLLRDGRQRKRLSQIIERRQRELDKKIRRAGANAIREAGCRDVPRSVADTFGRLAYRYSYGQNQLYHAVETAHLAAMLAHELGADVDIARAGGLFHDLGKAVDRDVEGTHAAIGARMALEAGIDPAIAHCIEAHHEEIEPNTIEALITIIADAASGSRPGARRESLENYLARLEALEAVAYTFPGVDKCYAIQAGRELRVSVDPQLVGDDGADRIAAAISRRIQDTLDYPGQIKVTVTREVRTVSSTR